MNPLPWQRLFERGESVLIGMVHLGALPGSPAHDAHAGLEPIVTAARRDVEALEAAGFDAVLFANEGDRPYRTNADLADAAALTHVVSLARPARIPFGVEYLFDPMCSMAVAAATGASFIRGTVTGVWESDAGLIIGNAAEVLRLRRALDAEHVGVFASPVAELSSSTGRREPFDLFRSAHVSTGLDVFMVSGPGPGIAVERELIRQIRSAVGPDVRLLLNTGAKAATIGQLLPYLDGCLVGSDVKFDGNLHNPVSVERASAFVRAARSTKLVSSG